MPRERRAILDREGGEAAGPVHNNIEIEQNVDLVDRHLCGGTGQSFAMPNDNIIQHGPEMSTRPYAYTAPLSCGGSFSPCIRKPPKKIGFRSFCTRHPFISCAGISVGSLRARFRGMAGDIFWRDRVAVSYGGTRLCGTDLIHAMCFICRNVCRGAGLPQIGRQTKRNLATPCAKCRSSFV